VPKPYPPEFRRRALDLLESGRSVRDVAASLGIAESCLHRWKSQDLLDRGLKAPTPEAIESAAPAAARARISELENGVKILRKAAAAVEEVVPTKARFALVAELAAEGVAVKQACLALGVSRSGFYDSRSRPPAARTIRQAWLTDQITAVHEASRQTYGAPRVRAELVHGQGVVVSRKTVALLMRRAGLAGTTAAPPGQARTGRGHGHRPGQTRLPPRRPESAVGHRHHRAPHSLDSSSRRNGRDYEAPSKASRRSAGVSQPRLLRGRPLSSSATTFRSSALYRDRSMPRGKYWRNRPLVFSLLPRCQGAPGSAK
jgi:transposase-like protein